MKYLKRIFLLIVTLILFFTFTSAVFADGAPEYPTCSRDSYFDNSGHKASHTPTCGYLVRHYYIDLTTYKDKFVVIDSTVELEAVDSDELSFLVKGNPEIMTGKSDLFLHKYRA